MKSAFLQCVECLWRPNPTAKAAAADPSGFANLRGSGICRHSSGGPCLLDGMYWGGGGRTLRQPNMALAGISEAYGGRPST